MQTKIPPPTRFFIAIILILVLACNFPATALFGGSPTNPAPQEVVQTATLFSGEPNNPVIVHTITPDTDPAAGAPFVYDCENTGSAPEKQASGCDRYDPYTVERPFKRDMSFYIIDMDIEKYSVFIDDNFVYVSIYTMGTNPNNEIGINFCVELDLNGDGFAKYIICATPLYQQDWTTNGVEVAEDTNHDTGGLSSGLSDAPLDDEKFDGYDNKIFGPGIIEGDPDMAWARYKMTGNQAIVEIAFKKELAGTSFLLGVLADAGNKDVRKYYLNDRYTEEEAGSPQKNEIYYPIKELNLFDNACRTPINYNANGFEPMLCPTEEPPPKVKNTPTTEETPCPVPSSCTGLYFTWDYEDCDCTYNPPDLK